MLRGVYVVSLAQETLKDPVCGASRRSQCYINSGYSFYVLKSPDLVVKGSVNLKGNISDCDKINFYKQKTFVKIQLELGNSNVKMQIKKM